MSVCLPQQTGNSMRAGIMSLWFAIISLAPGTINIYYLTNCLIKYSYQCKKDTDPSELKDNLLTHVSVFSAAECGCSESMGWERR